MEVFASNLIQTYKMDPLLRVDHKTTPYGRWLGHVTQFLKFGPLITFE